MTDTRMAMIGAGIILTNFAIMTALLAVVLWGGCP